MNNLLLIIDVQNDFVNNKTKRTIEHINELIKSNEYKYIVFTKFLNDENSNWYKVLN